MLWSGSINISRLPTGDPRSWIVESPLVVGADGGKRVEVPVGFVTDGASVPRAFWWYASPFSGRHAAAALVHDYCYQSACVTKEEADDIFEEAMLSCGVRKGKAKAMAASVRMFGRRAWNKHREHDGPEEIAGDGFT